MNKAPNIVRNHGWSTRRRIKKPKKWHPTDDYKKETINLHTLTKYSMPMNAALVKEIVKETFEKTGDIVKTIVCKYGEEGKRTIVWLKELGCVEVDFKQGEFDVICR